MVFSGNPAESFGYWVILSIQTTNTFQTEKEIPETLNY